MKIRVSATLKAKLTAWFASQSMLTFHIQTDSLDEAQNPGAGPLGPDFKSNGAGVDGGSAASATAGGSRSGEARERGGAWHRFKRWFSGLCIHANPPQQPQRRRSPNSRSAASASATPIASSAGGDSTIARGPSPSSLSTADRAGTSSAGQPQPMRTPSPVINPAANPSPPPPPFNPAIAAAGGGKDHAFAQPTIRPHPLPAMPLVSMTTPGPRPVAAAIHQQLQAAPFFVPVAPAGRRPSSITSRYFPREVWVAVYRFLSVGEFASVASTCRLMHALSVERAVWRGITDLRLMGNRMPHTSQLSKVFDRLSHLTSLSFASFNGAVRRRLLLNSEAVLLHAARACPHLRVVNLYGFSVSDTSARAFAQFCPEVTELYLSQSSVSDKGLQAIVAACRLQRLSLAHCRKLTDDGLRALGDALELSQLSLSDTAVSDTAIRTGVVACHALTTLYLSFTLVTDVGLRLLTSLPALSSLQLQCCSRISDTGVWDVANLCRTLTELDVSGNPQLTDEAISEFGASTVRRLTLSSCPNITAAARTAVASNGVAVLDDPEFCSELVEAEVAAEVYNKLELLAMADGYASVAEFVRVYMAAFLDHHQNAGRSEAAAAAAVGASPFPTGVGATAATPMPRSHLPPALPSHHLLPGSAPPPLAAPDSATPGLSVGEPKPKAAAVH